MSYGSLGEFEGAIIDVNGAFSELSGFSALAGVGRIILPIGVGAVVAFGTPMVLDYFVDDPATRASIMPYKWWIGIGAGAVAGAAMWKFQGPAEGVKTIATAAIVGLVGWGIERMRSKTTLVTDASAGDAKNGVSRYVVDKPQPVFARYVTEKPQPVFEKYVTDKAQPMFGKVVNVPFQPNAVMQGVNPGIFG